MAVPSRAHFQPTLRMSCGEQSRAFEAISIAARLQAIIGGFLDRPTVLSFSRDLQQLVSRYD
jgi:hypothetical protein